MAEAAIVVVVVVRWEGRRAPRLGERENVCVLNGVLELSLSVAGGLTRAHRRVEVELRPSGVQRSLDRWVRPPSVARVCMVRVHDVCTVCAHGVRVWRVHGVPSRSFASARAHRAALAQHPCRPRRRRTASCRSNRAQADRSRGRLRAGGRAECPWSRVSRASRARGDMTRRSYTTRRYGLYQAL